MVSKKIINKDNYVETIKDKNDNCDCVGGVLIYLLNTYSSEAKRYVLHTYR